MPSRAQRSRSIQPLARPSHESKQVTEFRSGKTIWTNSTADTVKVDRRNVPAIVAEMSSLADRTIEKLLTPLALSAIPAGHQ
jgi:hypothetical protein